jgi:hypothetical protein
MSTTNPELRPDPRTATADALIGWSEKSAPLYPLPRGSGSRDAYGARIIVLIRLVRDLVAARDAGRQHPYRDEED